MSVDSKTFYTRLAVAVGAILLLMVAAKFLFFGGQPGPAPTGSSSVSSQGGQPSGEVISWQDAAEHYGETCTVEGKIVATHNSGKACFLNFHPNWREYFTAVIFASAFNQFPPNPEGHYRGKRVRVTGRIKQYKGKPEIILNSPSQIEIVE